jgi:membrane protein
LLREIRAKGCAGLEYLLNGPGMEHTAQAHRYHRGNYFHRLWLLFRDSGKGFVNDKVVKLSASLAYYTIFSLPPMLMVVIALCSIFFGREAVQGQVFSQIAHLVGADAAAQIQEILKKTTLHHDSTMATVIGVATLVIGATGIFGEMQDSINLIWRLKTKPKKGLMRIIVNRLMSFSMLLVLGFVLTVSLVLNALLGAFFDHLRDHFSDAFVTQLYMINNVVMLGVTTLLFAFIFKVLPDARIKWRDVWIGAFVTSLMFLAGKFLISFYLQHNASISAYGATGSVIVILLWVYYSSLILYFGAEFTQVYVTHQGRVIHPNRYAVWVENKVIEKKQDHPPDKTLEKK